LYFCSQQNLYMKFLTKFGLYFLFPLYICLHISGCSFLYPNQMFQNNDYTPMVPKVTEVRDAYVIKIGDEISIKIFSRDGIKLVDVLDQAGIAQITSGASYVVNVNGMVELPVLGYFKVDGLREAELKVKLEKEFDTLFRNPFAYITVNNRRAFVFKGSSASIISLNRTPTSLIEVLAKSGGIAEDLKAYNIKIIRGNLKNPEIYEIDLSTMKGLTTADLTIQTNDIIYLETRRRPVIKALQEVTTYITAPLTLITSTLTLIYFIIKK
jgi:polysaccharide biosynthesis/export protein